MVRNVSFPLTGKVFASFRLDDDFILFAWFLGIMISLKSKKRYWRWEAGEGRNTGRRQKEASRTQDIVLVFRETHSTLAQTQSNWGPSQSLFQVTSSVRWGVMGNWGRHFKASDIKSTLTWMVSRPVLILTWAASGVTRIWCILKTHTWIKLSMGRICWQIQQEQEFAQKHVEYKVCLLCAKLFSLLYIVCKVERSSR